MVLQGKLWKLEGAHDNLQKENSLMLEEKRSLLEKVMSLEEKKPEEVKSRFLNQ